jgi:tRNA(Ile)-lysidine synthase
VLVAVSGGVDSVVLLDVLHRLAPRHGWRLVVAHFNHRLRGRESAGDERFVRGLARRLGWTCVTGRAEVRRQAAAGRVSIEMAARAARHAFYVEAARTHRARFVALAHHADDQVELVLLRLLRGAGSDGLGGMKWLGPAPGGRGLRLVRPLLGQTKGALRLYARNWSLPHREDASNRSVDILRNRVRRRLIPLLRKEFQPGLTEVILREAELLGAESDHLEAEAREWLAGGGGTFSGLSVALQRRILVEQLMRLGAEPQFEKVEALRRREAAPVAFGGGARLQRDADGRVRRAGRGPKSRGPGKTSRK